MLARFEDQIRRRKALALVLGSAILLAGASSLWSASRVVERQTHAATTERWAEEAAYAYAVPVVRNSTHWPVGTTLPMGLPAYYRTVSDSVTLSFAWRARDADATAHADMTLRIVAQTPDGRTYWEIVHPLAAAAADAPGEPLQLDATLDMDALVEDAARVGRELPIGEGRVRWVVETTVAYAATARGQRDEGTSVFAFPIVVQDPRFLLPDPANASWTEPHLESRTWTTERHAGASGALADLDGLALAGLGGALVAYVAWLAVGDPLRRLAARDAAYVREHLRHRDWVTTVTGPIDVSSFPVAVVDVANLETLIEAAADARCRVLHDHARRIYYAVLPNATYRYARHARAA